MKTVIFTLCFLISTALPAQIDCNKFLEQGKKAAQKENFELAMNSFNSARRCGDAAMGELVDKEVTKLFNAINRKMEQAEQEKQRAQEQTKIAGAARDSVAILLKSFQAVSAQVVDVLAEQSNKLILKMSYSDAAEKLISAASLDQPTQAFLYAVQEVAFFWTESGRGNKATNFLRETNQGTVLDTRETLRTFLEKMNAGHYRDLENRYFGEMVPIKGGIFKFGKDKLNKKEGIMAIVKDFNIARTETTFWQYGLFCAALRRDVREKAVSFWGYEGHDPILNVSWFEAIEYANWLSELRGRRPAYMIDSLQSDMVNTENNKELKWKVRAISGADGFRLPTEMEWEYAARGGKDFIYSCSDSLNEVAWYDKNAVRTHPVQTTKATAYNLYDMSGNVWEWCWDWYGDFPENPALEYAGVDSGLYRVHRGGSWNSTSLACRVANRGGNEPNYQGVYVGFRLAIQL